MIGAKTAANILLAGLGALAIFHVLLLLGVVPADSVWGGRAGEQGPRLAVLEAAGLVLTVVFAGIVAAGAGYFGPRWTGRSVAVAMWIVFGYFSFNVLGNLVSTSVLERMVFTPVAVVMALLSLRLAMSK
jgi:hypothetical protein